MKTTLKAFLYQNTQKILHKLNLHYMPPIYPEGDMQYWCKWCGIRFTIKDYWARGARARE